jgi:endonuclease/exonuclease/phosphatase (EEP) superfamily protein YafD
LRRAFSRWIIPGLVTFYGLAALLILLLREWVGEAITPLGLIYTRLDWCLLPALILFPLLLIFRRPRLALLMSPLGAAWLIHYLPLLLPKTISIPVDGRDLTVMTYNLHVERNILDPMIAVLRGTDADVVALQELSIEARDAIEAALADRYPYRAIHTLEWAYHGRGILSKYPVLEDRAWPDEQPITVRLQRSVIDFDGQHVVLYNFHAPPQRPIFGQPPDIAPRNQQHADLLAMMQVEVAPILMLCDCNISDQNIAYRNLTIHFRDAFREAGQGFGLTNPDAAYPQAQEGLWLPLYQRLDYIFYSPAFAALEAQVWPDSGGSDHRPVWARLRWIRP